MEPRVVFIFFVVALSLVFQVAAAYMAFRLIRATGKSIGWILIAAAIPFAALRRVVVLADILLHGIHPAPLAELMALGFSALLFLGLWKIEPFFLSIKQSDEKFKALAEKSLVGVYLIQDYVFRYVNPMMSEIFGYSVKDMTEGMGPKDIAHPEDWPIVEENLRRRISGETESVHYEFRCVRKDGQVINVEVFGSRTMHLEMPAIVGTLLDITERKKAEKEIISDKEEWGKTFDAIVDPIMILDRDYRITKANTAMAEKLGVSPAEAVGMTCYEHVHGVNEPPPQCPHRMLLADDKPHTSEIFEERLGGFFLVSVSPIYDETGKLMGSVHSARDITERKRAEADIMRMNRALETIRLCDQALVREKEEKPLLTEICRVLTEHSGYRMAWVGYAMDDEEKTVRPVAWAGTVEGYFDAAKITWSDTERGRGPTGTAIKTGKPFLVSNIATDPAMAPWREEALRRGYASSIALPLMDGPKGFGVFNIYAPVPDAFDKEEITLLTELSNDFADGIINIRTHEGKRAAEERVKRSLERLTALRDIDMAISSTFDLKVTLNILLDHVVAKLGVDAADVLLLNPHSQMLEHVSGRGFATLAASMVSQRLGEGYAGTVALERRQIILTGLSGMAGIEDKRLRALKEMEGFNFYIGLPLVAKGTVKGVLEIYHKSALRPDLEWLEFLASLAGQAAIAMENSLMLTELQRSHDELVMAYDATIEGWARALDYRDKETEGHSRRVTEMAASIAATMGMSDEELVQMRRGALLHDIGKLGIPDSILLKPGKLTDEEWKIMKTHPVIAHKILSPIAFLRPAIDIPYGHHEKWDGTGYPHGFREDEIPLSARIFSVVDVWDALRSDRPYRPAWTEDKTKEYIRSLSGKEFDPKVVEVFFRMLEVNLTALDACPDQHSRSALHP